MNNISAWSIRNPIPVILLFIVLTLSGIVGFNSMRINNNPDVEFPLIYVSASRPGAAPSELETQVTRLIEDAVSGLGGVRHMDSNVSDGYTNTIIEFELGTDVEFPLIYVGAGRPGAAPSELETQVTRLIEDAVAGLGGVRHMDSTVSDGYSTTIIEFELGTDVERATNDVRNAMAGLRGDLPQDMQEPTVQRIDITGDSLITYVVQSPTMSPEQLSWFVDNDISRALLAVPGVGEVNRQGGVDREIRVEIDPDRLAALGVTAAQVSQALVSANSDLPGGRVTVAGSERAIRIPGAAGSLDELRATRIPLSGGGSVRLGDLGQVEDTWTEPRAMARHNGQQVVTFNMLRSREASEVKVAERVREVVAEMDEAHPELVIQQVTANVEYIEESYLASMEAR